MPRKSRAPRRALGRVSAPMARTGKWNAPQKITVLCAFSLSLLGTSLTASPLLDAAELLIHLPAVSAHPDALPK